MHGSTIGVIGNAKSGRNTREAEAIDRAMAVFGPGARLVRWQPGQPLGRIVEALAAEGRDTIVAAGGDGTIMAVAGAMAGREGLRMGVLPLGTFNFFARGLGLPEDPEAAARALLQGTPRRIAVGKVNGQIFLNNASIGIYPQILKSREAVYGRWGRYRAAAHWSVIRTFLDFQHPMRLRLTADGTERRITTPLVFAARSAFQLERYGLRGAGAISDDKFALFVAKGGVTRAGLFRLAWRLVTRRLREGVDVELIRAADVTLETGRQRQLVAFDGEKAVMSMPLRFTITPAALTILVPPAEPAPPENTAQAAP